MNWIRTRSPVNASFVSYSNGVEQWLHQIRSHEPVRFDPAAGTDVHSQHKLAPDEINICDQMRPKTVMDAGPDESQPNAAREYFAAKFVKPRGQRPARPGDIRHAARWARGLTRLDAADPRYQSGRNS